MSASPPNTPTNTPPAKAPNTVPAQPTLKPTAPPPFKILSQEERTASRYIKMLVYGAHGSGKTWLCGTAADLASMNDVLMLSVEGGELTLDSDKKHAFHLIDSIRITNYKMVADTFDFLKLHCQLRDMEQTPEIIAKLVALEAKYKGVDPATITTPKRYKTVIIDSLTEVEGHCLGKLLNYEDGASMDEMTETAEWKHYKVQHAMMMRLVRYYRDLPMNVLMTCGVSFIQDESKRMIFAPQMTGKLAGKIQGIYDIVGYLVTGEAASPEAELPRRMYVQPSPRWSAKCRISSYKKQHFDNPTMVSIFKEIGLK